MEELRQESVKAERCEMARLMLADGVPLEKIMRYSRLSEEEVRALMGDAEERRLGSGTA